MANGWREHNIRCTNCGSSDAGSINTDGWFTCFSCGIRFEATSDVGKTKKMELLPLIEGDYRAVISRKITLETCKFFNYQVGKYKNQWVQIANYGTKTKVTGQKIRFVNKQQFITGRLVGLFGQSCWGDGGKALVITEGELDAMAYAQVTGCQWPIVSLPNGASGAVKAIRKELEWIEKFEKVYFWFDSDVSGKKAAEQVAGLLTPGKSYIVKTLYGLKDANDMLLNGYDTDMKKAIWQSSLYRPDSIVNGGDYLHLVLDKDVCNQKYPWKILNERVSGMRHKEIVTIVAGTGIGKSLFAAELAYSIVNSGDTIGYISLEEGMRRTVLRFVGFELNLPMHIQEVHQSISDEQKISAFNKTLGTKRYWFYDHFGSINLDNLFAKLRYYIKGIGVKWIFIDHISIIVSGMESIGDERRTIDTIMTSLRTLTEENDVGLVLVSHLKRPDGKGHEDGGVTSLSHIRGSGGIAQLSDIVIGLERCSQVESEEERNTVKVRVLKNRHTGEIGVAGNLVYDKTTGRLKEQTDEDINF